MSLGRFKRLALRSNDTWQGAIVRLPTWIDEGPDGRPYRPWGALWVSERTGLVHLEPEPAIEAHGPELALVALVELGLRQEKHLHGRAARLCVDDPDVAAFLTSRLGVADTTIEVVDDVPAVREVLQQFASDMAGGELPPAALDAPGMDVGRLRSFAEAAADFYRATPWEHLLNEDLVTVRMPNVPRGLSHVVVMGSGRVHFGLAFFDSRAEFERMAFGEGDATERFPGESWAVYFDRLDDLPIADANAWEQFGLPVAADDAYPYAVRAGVHGPIRRPSATELAHLEALLRAFAATTEDQLDAGQWSVQVVTHDGPMTVGLTLPLLLEAERDGAERRGDRLPDRRALERIHARVDRFMSGREFDSLDAANEALAEARQAGLFDADAAIDRAALTPLERAQELVYDAVESEGRLRAKRARQALAISPDCADAWCLLAEAASSLARMRELYVQATRAGERALGAEAFEALVGQFWGRLETRPYMRARLGLAQTLQALGEHDAAIDHLRDLLRLNPEDNQGARYILLSLLLRLDRNDEVEPLLKDYENDIWAEWRYGRALWMFRRHGDDVRARAALVEASHGNPHVVRWMLHPERMPISQRETQQLGSVEEAASCVAALREAWEATPGALEWLGRRAPGGATRPRAGKRRSRRRR